MSISRFCILNTKNTRKGEKMKTSGSNSDIKEETMKYANTIMKIGESFVYSTSEPQFREYPIFV